MSGVFTVELPRPLPVEERGGYWWLAADGVEVRLSNLDKVLFPRDGITKGDLLAYYWNVAPHLLSHVRGRPLTLKRMPDGIDGGHFYQKDAPDHTPGWMPRCAVEPEDGSIDEMLMTDTPAHVLFVINLGAIELHPLHTGCETYDCPDYLVFDLDPFPPAGFGDALTVARHVSAVLGALGLEGYPKTSGATGIQVYVPVSSRHTFTETRELCERLGRMILEADPERVTMEWRIEDRTGRVFIDHNMNRRAASLAAPYSVRPRDRAPVSMPLQWAEVEEGAIRPDDFRIDNAFQRLERVGDLFAPVATTHQDLGPALERFAIPPGEGDPSGGRLRRAIPSS